MTLNSRPSYFGSALNVLKDADDADNLSLCSAVMELEDVTETQFLTNSTYVGQWNKFGMSGRGVFTFPHNVTFDGIFEDGQFVEGVYHYPLEQNISCLFLNQYRDFTFSDGLPFLEDDWSYCCGEDRRYLITREKGFKPSPNERVTAGTLRPIAPGMYDTGDGFYDPQKKCVLSYAGGAIVRIPTATEEKWIFDHCRKADDVAVGYRPDLYEKWTTGAKHRRKEKENLVSKPTTQFFDTVGG